MVFIKYLQNAVVATKIFSNLNFINGNTFHYSLQEFVHKICCWNLLNKFDWFCYKALHLNYVVLGSVF